MKCIIIILGDLRIVWAKMPYESSETPPLAALENYHPEVEA